jgi:hypothetical protein
MALLPGDHKQHKHVPTTIELIHTIMDSIDSIDERLKLLFLNMVDIQKRLDELEGKNETKRTDT